jgi:multiple sugar transport system permease protein
MANYVELLRRRRLLHSLKNNVIWLVLFMLAVPAGPVHRAVSQPDGHRHPALQVAVLLPFVISQVVVGLIFSWFYAPNFGLFYKLIEWLTGTGIACSPRPATSPTASSPPVSGRRSPIA